MDELYALGSTPLPSYHPTISVWFNASTTNGSFPSGHANVDALVRNRTSQNGTTTMTTTIGRAPAIPLWHPSLESLFARQPVAYRDGSNGGAAAARARVGPCHPSVIASYRAGVAAPAGHPSVDSLFRSALPAHHPSARVLCYKLCVWRPRTV